MNSDGRLLTSISLLARILRLIGSNAIPRIPSVILGIKTYSYLVIILNLVYTPHS